MRLSPSHPAPGSLRISKSSGCLRSERLPDPLGSAFIAEFARNRVACLRILRFVSGSEISRTASRNGFLAIGRNQSQAQPGHEFRDGGIG